MKTFRRLFVIAVLTCATAAASAQLPFFRHFILPGGLTSSSVALIESPQGGYFGVAFGGPDNNKYTRIFRFNSQGDTLWSKTYPSYYSGGTFVLRFAIRAAPAPDGGLFILTASNIPESWFNTVLRLNASGDSLWQTTISYVGQYSAARMISIAATPDGGCVIAGSGQWAPSAPRLVKLSANGTIEWENTNFPGDMGYNKFNGVSVNEQGEIFATGVVHHNLNGSIRLLVARVNPAGETVWANVYFSGLPNTGDSIMGYGNATVPTPDGGCIAGGHITDVGFQNGGRALLMKFNADGSVAWTKKYFRWDWSDQKAVVFGLFRQNNGNYLSYIHQNYGTSNPALTLMSIDSNGDSLWTQRGLYNGMWLQGKDAAGNILFWGALPHPNVNWWDHAIFVKTTPDGIFQTPQNQIPSHGATNLTTPILFQWTPTDHKGQYTLEFYTDSLCTQLVASYPGILTNTISLSNFQSLTTYFWRVRIHGPMGGYSAWSTPTKFTTSTVTGLVEMTGKEMKIFPNPASHEVTIILSEGTAKVPDILIIRSTGQTFRPVAVIREDDYTLHVRFPYAMPAGVYVMKVTASQSTQQQQLIIQ